MTNWARSPFFFYSFLVNIKVICKAHNISHSIKCEIYTFNLSAHYKAGRRWWAPPRGSPEHSYCLSPWGACSCWSSDWEARLGEQLLTWGRCQLGKEESYNIQWPGIRTSSTLLPSNVPNTMLPVDCCFSSTFFIFQTDNVPGRADVRSDVMTCQIDTYIIFQSNYIPVYCQDVTWLFKTGKWILLFY